MGSYLKLDSYSRVLYVKLDSYLLANKGYIIPVSVERYGTLENLSRELSNFLDHPLLPSGVKFIFTLDG